MKQAAVALIERDGKILCVWNRRFQGWGLPGGKVEEGEGLIATIQRELREETGLHASRIIQFYKAESALSDGPRQVYVFRIIAYGEPCEMEENCPIKWMTREELVDCSPFREFYIKMFAPPTGGRHGASKGAGWALRIHDNGGSWLNTFSGGDVVVFDTREEAEEDARLPREQRGAENVTIEYVEKGRWEPSTYDRAFLDLIQFTMHYVHTTSDRENAAKALDAVNRARALLSRYAPELVRTPTTLPGEKL